jgi:glycosyltransferase involved in cell wall biosynthesis
MILVYHGPVPYEQSWERGLFNAFSRKIVIVYVDGDPLPFSLKRFNGNYLKTVLAELPQTSGLLRVTLPSLLPLARFDFIARANRWLAMRAFLRALRGQTKKKVVLVAQNPGLLRTLRGLPANLSVYDVVDDYVGLAALTGDRRSVKTVKRYHQRTLRESDIVLATSSELVRAIKDQRPEVFERSNGVDFQAFANGSCKAEPKAMFCIRRPRVGLVGRLNDRIDWSLVSEICECRPDWSLVFVGPLYGCGEVATRAVCKLAKRSNFHLLPAVDESEMPAYISALDVCLIPYRALEGNLGINPLKLYQYLAVGRPVVATPLPSIVAFRDVVQCCETTDQFVAAIEEQLLSMDDPVKKQTRQNRAKEFDWQNIADKQLAIINNCLSLSHL